MELCREIIQNVKVLSNRIRKEGESGSDRLPLWGIREAFQRLAVAQNR